jgi:hypothetical protein
MSGRNLFTYLNLYSEIAVGFLSTVEKATLVLRTQQKLNLSPKVFFISLSVCYKVDMSSPLFWNMYHDKIVFVILK